MTSRSEIKSTAVYFLFKNSKLFLQRKFSAFDLLKVVKKLIFYNKRVTFQVSAFSYCFESDIPFSRHVRESTVPVLLLVTLTLNTEIMSTLEMIVFTY